MKKILLLLLLLVSYFGYSQSGLGYVNYKAVRTHYGNGNTSQYPNFAQSTADFDKMLDLTNPANTLIGEGEVVSNSQQGFARGLPPGVPGDFYVVEYTGWFYAELGGRYLFYTYSDDSAEVWVGDSVLGGKYNGPGTSANWIDLESDTWYPLKYRWQEYSGNAYGYLQVYGPRNGYFYPGGATSVYQVTNIDPNTPIDPSVDFQFEFNSNMEPDKIKYGVYYDNSTEQDGSDFWNTTITNLPYLDSDGTTDVTDYLHLDKISNGKKATTTGGSVEWCVVYDYDNTNKRYRVGIDKREFPSGISSSDVKQLQLFDVWDGDVTFKSDDGTWGEYYIYTDTQLDFTNSTSSSYIRDANGFYGMRAEFSFEDVEIYKKHRLLFVHGQDLWNPELFMDDYVTVGDVVSAFSELSGGGINGGYKGDLNGVQLQNADIMRVIPKSEYDGTTTSNWKTQPNKGIKSGVDFDLIYDSIQQPQYKVTFLGDVNLSHSPAQSTTTNTTSKIMSVRKSISQNNTLMEVDLDIEKTNENIIVTLKLPENQQNIIGSEFRVGFDDTRVTYDKVETNSTLQNFNAERTNYIKFGSISTDGSQNLNGGVEYKIYFSPQQNFDSILGLVSILKSELVTNKGTIIESIIK
jgi:hypothetical protein